MCAANVEVMAFSPDAQSIQCAKQHLGCGYDSTADVPNRFLAQVVDSFSEEQIAIGQHQSFSVSEIDTTFEEATQKTQYRIGFDLHVPRTPLGFSGRFTQEGQPVIRTHQFVCAFLQLYSVECWLKGMPPLKKNLPIPHPPQGDAVVRSGHAVTGYRICLEIAVAPQETDQQADLEGRIHTSVSQGLVELGIDAIKMHSNLHSKTIRHVKIIEMTGFGGYVPPTQAISEAEDFGHVVSAIEGVKTDFLQRLPTIERWHFSLNPSVDLISYDSIPRYPATIAATPAAAAAAQPFMLSPSEQLLPEPSSALIYYDSLWTKMRASFSEEYRTSLDGLLRGIYPSIMLRRISEIFSQTSRIGGGALPSSHALVIGNSGVGKTVLIGHLLGLGLKKQRVFGKVRPVYDYTVQDPQNPPIGHFGAETKGCKRYHQFLDAAGLFDTQGIEANICNSIAIEMATKIYPVGHLIVVLPPTAFEDRAAEFRRIVHTLRRVVGNFERMDVFLAILFVFNDKIGNDDEETIDAFIQETKNALGQDIDKEVCSPGWWETIKAALPRRFVGGGQQQGNAELPSIPKDLPEEVQHKIQEYIDTIMMLDLLSKQHNFICTNFEDGSTRKKISDWLRITPCLESTALQMRKLVHNGYDKFVFFLTAICTYFNKLHSERQGLREHLRSILDAIKSTQSFIEILARKPSEAKRDLALVIINDNIDALNRKKTQIEKTIQILKQERNYLTESTNETLLLSIMPIITSSFWNSVVQQGQSWQNSALVLLFFPFQIKLTFNSEGNPPLVRIKKKEGSGQFYDEDVRRLDEGDYEIKYRNLFGGYYSDLGKGIHPNVWLYVRKKDHPSSIARVGEIELELRQLHSTLEDADTGIEVRIARENASRDHYIRAVQQDKEKQIEEKRQELLRLKNQQGICKQKVKSLESEFDSHKEYCSLIAEIIQKLNLISQTEEETSQIFQRFVNIFQ